MRLLILTSVTMIAFAANSLLTRVAVEAGDASAGGFAILRVAAGAVMLLALCLIQKRTPVWLATRRLGGAFTLSVYMVGFSLAYLTLDAGLGALVLFGVVQITMFGMSSILGRRPGGRDLLGAAVAFGGLAWVLWPGAGVVVDPFGAVCMVLAGMGWAAYTLLGRAEADPLAGTAGNFAIALPITAGAFVMAGVSLELTVTGAAFAIISGAVTSGLGYALWYGLQPQLGAARSAVVQLSVPVIALALGAALLGEEVGLQVILGSALVLGGIALTLPFGKGR